MEGIAVKPATGVHFRRGSLLKSGDFFKQTRFCSGGPTLTRFRKLSLSHARAQQSKEEHATVSPASVLELIPAELKKWRENCEKGDMFANQGIRIRRRPPNGPPSHDEGPSQFHLHIEGTTPQNILEEIIWHKDTEVSLLKESLPLDTLRKALENVPPARDFVGALRASYLRTGLPALIAEVKKASPSRGVLREDFDPVQIAEAYEAGGAACLSVLTDEKYFQGSFNNLEAVRNAGVKVHDEREMDRVLGIDGIKLIGINNRDLETFEVDISNTRRLLEGERGEVIRKRDIIVVGESGLFTPDDVAYVQDAGVKAVLVGESIVKQADPTKGIAGLFGKDISH